MKEYIEREAVLQFPIRKDHCDKEHANKHFIFGVESVMEYVENLPADDVAEVRHGRWIRQPSEINGLDVEFCSECGQGMNERNQFWNAKYCPNCGARMGKEE